MKRKCVNLLLETPQKQLSMKNANARTVIVAVTEGLVREEQLLHDMWLLGAVTVEITQILTRARI